MINSYLRQGLLYVGLLLACLTVRAENPEHELLLIPANTEQGFAYLYFLRIPKTLPEYKLQYLIEKR